MASTETPSVRGLDVDGQGRCAHWHGRTDVVAIRLPCCCDEYWACHACHEQLAGHNARPWPRAEFDRTAVLCGVCATAMTITQYLACSSRCPACGAGFNPRCERHHPLYFEVAESGVGRREPWNGLGRRLAVGHTIASQAGMGMRHPDTAPRHRGIATVRWPWAILAYLAAGLALAGIFVPGLPTTPFVLLAAWAAARGSERLHAWLVRHPHLGPILADWRDQRAISTGAKLLAVLFLAVSFGLMLWRGIPGWMLTALGILFATVGTFVVTRPRPR